MSFLGDLLVGRVVSTVRTWRDDGQHKLYLAGGCALNIKWNSALRDCGLFDEVWVPPFPNDSGSALGAALLGRIQHAGIRPLGWQLRPGPALRAPGVLPAEWVASAAGPAEVAQLLHETGEPVVVLNDRAELGPRALGGRSILAAPTSAAMKDTLNRIKRREAYRPIAPVCPAEEAPKIFDPGTADPFMLFDHAVRPAWLDRIPAIVHLDGTARLQTVHADDEPVLTEVLRHYHRLSGVPVLCNTSANRSRCGFFPDVSSATPWGEVSRIWSDDVLYQRLGRS